MKFNLSKVHYGHILISEMRSSGWEISELEGIAEVRAGIPTESVINTLRMFIQNNIVSFRCAFGSLGVDTYRVEGIWVEDDGSVTVEYENVGAALVNNMQSFIANLEVYEYD